MFSNLCFFILLHGQAAQSCWSLDRQLTKACAVPALLPHRRINAFLSLSQLKHSVDDVATLLILQIQTRCCLGLDKM
jgi:hypothetical protein